MLHQYRCGKYFVGSGSGYTSYEEQAWTLRKTFNRLLATLEARQATGGDLLEIGCGYGYFLEAATTSFRSLTATDMSEEAVRRARATGADVFLGGIDAVPMARRFDLVVALHVLEHVYSPRQFIQQLLSRVKPGGHLLVAVPDMGSIWRRLLGSHWPSFKYPEHIVFYDEGTLRSLLQSMEMVTEVDPVPYPHAFPVAEVCRKVGLPVSSWAKTRFLWFPATTLAFLCSSPRREGR